MTGEAQPIESVTIEASLTDTGLSLKTKSRLVSALDRIFGGLFALPAAFIDNKINEANLISELRKRRLESEEGLRLEGDLRLSQLEMAASYIKREREIRRILNLSAVVRLAIEDLRESHEDAQSSSDQDSGIDDQWINQFTRFSEGASTERLRSLFGKILSGECKQPGTFSPAALRAVSELTQSLATDFQWIWAKRIDHQIWNGPEFGRGEAWERLTRLRDAGLLSPIDSGIHQPDFLPIPGSNGLSFWRLAAGHGGSVTVAMKAAIGAWLPVINFTAIGLELGELIPAPDYESNLRAVALRFPKASVAWIKLAYGTQFEETLWEEN